MGDIETEKQRFQFGLKKLLLWTAIVALGLGLLSFTEPPIAGWILVPGWFAAVLGVRWALGRDWAVTTSIVIGVLFYACGDYQHSPGLGVVTRSGVVGALMGIAAYALVLMTSRVVNRIDGVLETPTEASAGNSSPQGQSRTEPNC